jgi:hypothetical protein
VRKRLRARADRHHDLAAQAARDGDEAVGERRVPQVRLDAGEDDEVVRLAGEACDPELVRRPADLARRAVVDPHLRALLREVEEGIGIDRRDDRSGLVAHQPLERARRDLGDVEPTAERDDHDRRVERLEVLEGRGEDVVDVHDARRSVTSARPSRRRRTR